MKRFITETVTLEGPLRTLKVVRLVFFLSRVRNVLVFDTFERCKSRQLSFCDESGDGVKIIDELHVIEIEVK